MSILLHGRARDSSRQVTSTHTLRRLRLNARKSRALKDKSENSVLPEDQIVVMLLGLLIILLLWAYIRWEMDQEFSKISNEMVIILAHLKRLKTIHYA